MQARRPPAQPLALREGVASQGFGADSGSGLLTGSLAVLLILTFSRWGSTIGVGSLYLTDILIAAALVYAGLNYRAINGPGSFRTIRTASLPPILLLFLAYVLVRFALSFANGPVLDWVRDAVPYLYSVMAVVAATSYATAGAARRARTAKVLTVGLAIHLVWTSIVQLTPLNSVYVTVPLVGAPIFSPRPDIEAALNSVLAAVCVRALIVHPRYRVLAFLGLALASVVVLAQGTRAGTLALIACLLVGSVLTYAGLGRLDGRRVAMTLAAPAVLLVAVVVLPLTTPGQRIVATIFPDQVTSASEAQQNAEGTANARRLTWSGVIGWTEDSTPRLFVGSGFGNNFLEQSQTLQYLEGTDYTNVRSPHDYWIGSFARMGLVGLALLAGTVLLGFVTLFRRRVAIAAEPTAFISAMLMVAMIPVASLGVVLEAPFGAVPFFWGLGVVFAFRRSDDERLPPQRPVAPRSAFR